MILSKEMLDDILKMYADGMSIRGITKELGVNRASIVHALSGVPKTPRKKSYRMPSVYEDQKIKLYWER